MNTPAAEPTSLAAQTQAPLPKDEIIAAMHELLADFQKKTEEQLAALHAAQVKQESQLAAFGTKFEETMTKSQKAAITTAAAKVTALTFSSLGTLQVLYNRYTHRNAAVDVGINEMFKQAIAKVSNIAKPFVGSLLEYFGVAAEKQEEVAYEWILTQARTGASNFFTLVKEVANNAYDAAKSYTSLIPLGVWTGVGATLVVGGGVVLIGRKYFRRVDNRLEEIKGDEAAKVATIMAALSHVPGMSTQLFKFDEVDGVDKYFVLEASVRDKRQMIYDEMSTLKRYLTKPCVSREDIKNALVFVKAYQVSNVNENIKYKDVKAKLAELPQSDEWKAFMTLIDSTNSLYELEQNRTVIENVIYAINKALAGILKTLVDHSDEKEKETQQYKTALTIVNGYTGMLRVLSNTLLAHMAAGYIDLCYVLREIEALIRIKDELLAKRTFYGDELELVKSLEDFKNIFADGKPCIDNDQVQLVQLRDLQEFVGVVNALTTYTNKMANSGFQVASMEVTPIMSAPAPAAPAASVATETKAEPSELHNLFQKVAAKSSPVSTGSSSWPYGSFGSYSLPSFSTYPTVINVPSRRHHAHHAHHKSSHRSSKRRTKSKRRGSSSSRRSKKRQSSYKAVTRAW